MRDNFFLLGLLEGIVAGSLAIPIAVAIGLNPSLSLVTGLLLAIVPGLSLTPFATDFASDTAYSPNLAARILHAYEFIRGNFACWALSSVLMLPVGLLTGWEHKQLAAFTLTAGAVLYLVAEIALLKIHRRIGDRNLP